MYKHIYRLILSAILISLAAISASAKTNRVTTLGGGQAVKQLKAEGSYESLLRAVNISRQENAPDSGLNPASQLAKLVDPNGVEGDRFGESISVSGDTVVIGAYLADQDNKINVGAAYVYVRNGNTWIQQAKLVGLDGVDDDRFGSGVAVWNDTIVVGAMGVDGNVFPNEGAAYVFTRSGGVWTQRAKLIVGNPNVVNFGVSVALEGNTMVVGSLEDVNGNDDQGSAYVFTGSGDTWTQQAKLTAADPNIAARFGWSVSISGDTVIAGAHQGRVGNANYQGSAYIFTRSGNVWTQQAKLVASDGEQFEEFGWSVGISGDTAIVGARDDSTDKNFGHGSAYVFVRNGSTWTQQAKLLAADFFPWERFGWSVSVSGNTAVVGALFANLTPYNAEGAAYVFTRSGGTWTQRAKLRANDASRLDGFGMSSVVSGSNIFIGADSGNAGGNLEQGAAYIFNFIPQRALFDFDGDSRADVSVFRPSDRVWYLNQSTNGFFATQFGLSTDKLAPADFDGDGRTDIAVFRDGTWYWINSSSLSVGIVQFGLANDIPVPADYTGDGRAELAVYRSGVWWMFNLANNQSSAVGFGLSTDKPVPADFDGDLRTDQAIYRNGEWHLNRSTLGYTVVTFGLADDKPAVGDYDGDGRADQAVYRNGTWYILGSAQGVSVVQFGLAADIPVPADYDGDGKTDIAVFREGVWYLQQTTSGVSIQQFGLANDQPAPAAFLP